MYRLCLNWGRQKGIKGDIEGEKRKGLGADPGATPSFKVLVGGIEASRRLGKG